jgi:hypothetical protein
MQELRTLELGLIAYTRLRESRTALSLSPDARLRRRAEAGAAESTVAEVASAAEDGATRVLRWSYVQLALRGVRPDPDHDPRDAFRDRLARGAQTPTERRPSGTLDSARDERSSLAHVPSGGSPSSPDVLKNPVGYAERLAGQANSAHTALPFVV